MRTLTRLPNWRTRLYDVIASRSRQPFAWGTNDCALFAAACVEAVSGVDFYAPFRGQYLDEEGAASALVANGFVSLKDLIAANFREIHQAVAQDGDLAMIGTDEGLALGVFVGERVHVLSPNGHATVKRVRAVNAFKVA